MAFDPRFHEIEPRTGFQVDKETGHPTGLIGRPHMPVSDARDYPKWVAAHESHVVRKKMDGMADHVSTPNWAECHVHRVTGEVSVRVADADEETRAMSEVSLPVVVADESGE